LDKKDAYHSLANAIIIQAYKDLKALLLKRKRIIYKIENGRNTKYNREALLNNEIAIKRILYFFDSEYYSCLTTVNASYLLKDLEELKTLQ